MNTQHYLDCSLIFGAHDNIRSEIDEESLNELAESINQFGLLNPLTVQKIGDQFKIIAGHRRYAAWQRSVYANTAIPCIVLRNPLNDADRISAMLIENCQRVDITPLDEAFAYAALVEEGMKQTAIAKKVGKSDAHVSKRLGLTRLPANLQTMLKNGNLTIDHAYRLSHIDTAILEAEEWKHGVDEWRVKRLETKQLDVANDKKLQDWLIGRTDIVEEEPENVAYVGRFTGGNIDRLMVSDNMVMLVKKDFRGYTCIEVFDTASKDQADEWDDDDDNQYEAHNAEYRRTFAKYEQDKAEYQQAKTDWITAQLKHPDHLTKMINAVMLGMLYENYDHIELVNESQQKEAQDWGAEEVFARLLGNPRITEFFIASYCESAEPYIEQELAALGVQKPQRPDFNRVAIEEEVTNDTVEGDDYQYDPVEEDWSDDAKYESDYYAVDHE
jgi:ParB/RepB/Spo0J family partition protein